MTEETISIFSVSARRSGSGWMDIPMLDLKIRLSTISITAVNNCTIKRLGETLHGRVFAVLGRDSRAKVRLFNTDLVVHENTNQSGNKNVE